jgi:hypothetical protein
MNLPRRVELCLGCGAFAALGAAFCFMAWGWWRTGVMRLTPLGGTLEGWPGAAVAWGYALLGVGSMVAAAVFLRARWTPPLPGDPVQPAHDRP